MYKVKAISEGRILGKSLAAEDDVSPLGVVRGAGLKDCFLAEAVEVGAKPKDHYPDIKKGDILLIDNSLNERGVFYGLLLLDYFEVVAIVEKDDSPNTPDTPDDKKIDSTVTVS